MIFSVQNSFSHSMILFLSLCLHRLIKWIEKKSEKRSCFQVLKIQGQDEHEGHKSDWRRSQCHAYHTPSHAWQGEAFTVATAVACILSACARLPSEPDSGIDRGSAPLPPIWVKRTIATTEKSPPSFQSIVLKFALQPEFIGTNPASNKPVVSRSGG